MNVNKLLNNQGKLWLNVASSYVAFRDYVNLDNSLFLALLPFYPVFKFILKPGHKEIVEKYKQIRRAGAPIFRCNCYKPLPFPDGSVDHILCSHFLEHAYPDVAIKMLNNYYRLLKKGGTLHLVVPDLSVIANGYISRKNKDASAEVFLKETLLTLDKRPSLPYRILEALGGYGLRHYWMYDEASLISKMRDAGFTIVSKEESSSRFFERDGLHVVGKK